MTQRVSKCWQIFPPVGKSWLPENYHRHSGFCLIGCFWKSHVGRVWELPLWCSSGSAYLTAMHSHERGLIVWLIWLEAGSPNDRHLQDGKVENLAAAYSKKLQKPLVKRHQEESPAEHGGAHLRSQHWEAEAEAEPALWVWGQPQLEAAGLGFPRELLEWSSGSWRHCLTTEDHRAWQHQQHFFFNVWVCLCVFTPGCGCVYGCVPEISFTVFLRYCPLGS